MNSLYSYVQQFLCRCLSVGVLICVVAGLLACNSMPSYDRQAGANLQVKIKDPERMRFSGKGAGAGIMLMSSLGAAGIAVGIAIDEGIGKDIDSTAVAAGFNIDGIVREAYQSAVKAQADSQVKPLWGVNVVRYGFVSRPGKGDPSLAQLHMRFFDSKSAYDNNEETLRIDYPESFEVDDVSASLPLEVVKAEGDKIIEMHSKAMTEVMVRWFSFRN